MREKTPAHLLARPLGGKEGESELHSLKNRRVFMEKINIDLKKEQQASMARPRYKYSAIARFFFLSMDLVTGRKVTLAKAKLLEILACIPYRAWESRQYARMTKHYRNQELVRQSCMIMTWGREAQDNEYRHLLVIDEKMKEDRARDPWYLFPPIPFLMVAFYALLTWTMALLAIRRAFLFNAEFEDHAEHVYAQFVQEHPEWEEQPVNNELVKEYGVFQTWAEVFRRIGLDERDHMNSSFIFCGKPNCVVEYEGMPISNGASF
jgi:ubiquinol oxidase